MEYIVAFLAVTIAVGYALFIAVNIEKGKSWALEIAKAVSMLDPESVNHYLRHEAARTELPVEPVETEQESAPDRLAA